ncbi:MAG: glycosyl transferase family 2 [Bacillales bacterium]|jgi:glycosyltransferase involved in cell wall biosynthesis|nr:glycosyl transferase family 2 [Bacillales bacterium]
MNKKVSVVMATYNPHIGYLEEQLKSIENQTYPDLELLICDDCSSSEKYSEIQQLAHSVLKKTPYTVFQNEKNMGSNRTFERLTQIATGDYIAYSDQDDIFDLNKIQELVDLMEIEKGVLVYSDARVIDGEGHLLNDSFKSYGKRIVHVHGENQTSFFIRRNSVTGCTMLIRSDVAKSALPFPDYKIYVHDHWLTLIASTVGKISYSEKPFISYRIHGNNQIGSSFLKKIDDKESYLKNKLLDEKERYAYLVDKKKYFNGELSKEIEAYLLDVKTRIAFFQQSNVKNFVSFIRNRKIDWQLFLFEMVVAIMPENVQRKIFTKVKGM